LRISSYVLYTKVTTVYDAHFLHLHQEPVNQHETTISKPKQAIINQEKVIMINYFLITSNQSISSMRTNLKRVNFNKFTIWDHIWINPRNVLGYEGT
jgi:hypothetical protein